MQRILVIKLSSLGDVVHALPVGLALRQSYPQAHIAWLTEEEGCALLEKQPFLNQILCFRKKEILGLVKTARAGRAVMLCKQFFQDLRRLVFDAVIDAQGLFKSAFLCYLSRTGVRIGFSNAREMAFVFYTNKVVPVKGLHAVPHYLSLLHPLDIHFKAPHQYYFVPDEDTAWIKSLLYKEGYHGGNLIIIHPGASSSVKMWSGENFSNLADHLGEKGCQVVFTGSAEERELVSDIQQRMRFQSIDMSGKINLMQLAALAKLSSVFIAGDTGPLHLASAAGASVVGLYRQGNCPTLPFGDSHRVVYALSGNNINSVPLEQVKREVINALHEKKSAITAF